MWNYIRKSERWQRIASWTIASLIRLLDLSIKWKMVVPPATQRIFKLEKPIILLFWHNRILSMPAGWDVSRPITLLRSAHRDGLLIGRAISFLGYKTVAGSSNRGGATSLRKLLKELKNGTSIGITPDGPRGPRMRMTPGAIVAARLGGVPIIPVAWNTKHRKLLGTWDKMILARPFSKGIFIYGEPIEIPKKSTHEEVEAYRMDVEKKLNELSRATEEEYGHSIIEPAPSDHRNFRTPKE